MSQKILSVKLYNEYDFPVLGVGTHSSNPTESWVDLIKYAIDIGYRHIDCASYYGNEKEIGKAIQEKIAEGVIAREDIFVTSKLWNNKHDRDSVVPALKKTLACLDLQYLDLYLIHWPFSVPDIPSLGGIPMDENGKVLTTSIDYKETWKGMEYCIERGLSKSIGLSNFNIEQIKDVVNHAKYKPAVLQVECHPYLAQCELIDFCKSMNIVMTSHTPLGRSIPSFKGRSLLKDPVVKTLARKYSKTPAQILIRFQVERGVTVIAKSTNKLKLQENFETLNFNISVKNVLVLESLDKNERYVKFEEYAEHKYYPFKPTEESIEDLSNPVE